MENRIAGSAALAAAVGVGVVRSAAKRFSASLRNSPVGNTSRYASKSAEFVLFMIDCQNTAGQPAAPSRASEAENLAAALLLVKKPPGRRCC